MKNVRVVWGANRCHFLEEVGAEAYNLVQDGRASVLCGHFLGFMDERR